MAVLIEEPREKDIDLNDWHKLLNKTTIAAFNLNDMQIENRTVLRGSRFAINGSLYVCENDESITSWDSSLVNYTQIYIYVSASGNSATFYFDILQPSYQATKLAWYHPTKINDRALAMGYKLNNDFFVTEYIARMRLKPPIIDIASRGYLNAQWADNKILANSVYEANGFIYGAVSDVTITGFSNTWSEGSYIYIYAQNNKPNTLYYYSNIAPVRDLSRGGMYRTTSHNDRAIGVGIKIDGTFRFIDWLFPWSRFHQITSTIYVGNQDRENLILNPGKYLVILRGGKGGNGGEATINTISNVQAGINGKGSPGQVLSQEIYISSASTVSAVLEVGRNGGNGNKASGTYSSFCIEAGSGGGGGFPATLFINTLNLKIQAAAGHGGGGASGRFLNSYLYYFEGGKGATATIAGVGGKLSTLSTQTPLANINGTDAGLFDVNNPNGVGGGAGLSAEGFSKSSLGGDGGISGANGNNPPQLTTKQFGGIGKTGILGKAAGGGAAYITTIDGGVPGGDGAGGEALTQEIYLLTSA